MTVKCLLCEKDLERDERFIYDGGAMTVTFGYGSRFDQAGVVATTPTQKLLVCDESEAYI